MTFDDPLRGATYPTSMWTATNAAEAVPGVSTPLSFTYWADATELGVRGAFKSMGALLREHDTQMPEREEDRLLIPFYGRPALRVNFLAEMGDRMPGSNGVGIAEHIFAAEFPPDFTSRPRRQYYPVVAVKLPTAMIRGPRMMCEGRARTQQFWSQTIPRVADADIDQALAIFMEARSYFRRNVYLAALGLFVVVQPVFEALEKVVAAAGADIDPAVLMGGYGGHEETHLVADLWDCSRDRLTMAEFLSRHGYHGPNEGQLAARSWREDASPLESLMAGYRGKPEGDDPRLADQARMAARLDAERRVLAALPRHRRLATRKLFDVAANRLPLRAVAKVAFLQSLDVARAAARRLGDTLTEQGHLDDPSDVFFLTADEVIGRQWHDARERIKFRRERYEEYLDYDVPNSWIGDTEPLRQTREDAAEEISELRGVAASHGEVVGRVRVVTDPATMDVEPGDVLVAHFTDPSWSAVLFLASALVIDIGGKLSHAAVVAREMGVPCVADTKNGTRVLQTGDLVRVDGTSGVVEILERAGSALGASG